MKKVARLKLQRRLKKLKLRPPSLLLKLNQLLLQESPGFSKLFLRSTYSILLGTLRMVSSKLPLTSMCLLETTTSLCLLHHWSLFLQDMKQSRPNMMESLRSTGTRTLTFLMTMRCSSRFMAPVLESPTKASKF